MGSQHKGRAAGCPGRDTGILGVRKWGWEPRSSRAGGTLPGLQPELRSGGDLVGCSREVAPFLARGAG
jgi:hypothetical protein